MRMRMAGACYVCILVAAILASLLQSMHGLTDPEDVQSLQQLFGSLNTPLLIGWNSSGGDPCGDSWQGVTCDGENVIQIKLSGLELGGGLSWSLDKFKHLTLLDLSTNQLQGQIPYNLPPNLQHLDLHRNHLVQNIPWSIGQLIALTDLDISYNNFTGEIPKSIGGLTKLSNLYLQDNELSSGLDSLDTLPLQTLDISNNVFTGMIPAQLLNIPSFQYSGNPLSLPPVSTPGPPPHSFSPPPPARAGAPPHKSPPPKKAPGTESKQGSSSFWSGGRIAGVTIATILAVAATVLIFLFFKWKNCEENGNEEDKRTSSASWLGPLIPPAKGRWTR